MSGILSIDLPKEERSTKSMASLNGYLVTAPKKEIIVWVVKGDKVNSVPVKLGEYKEITR